MTEQDAVNIVYKNSFLFQRMAHRIMLWDENKTYYENSLVVGVKYPAIMAFARRYGLKAKPIYNRPRTKLGINTMRYRLIMELRNKKGWSMPQIGSAFGVSRQRIEQMLHVGAQR